MKLYKVNLHKVNLYNVNLHKVKLYKVNLYKANLYKANQAESVGRPRQLVSFSAQAPSDIMIASNTNYKSFEFRSRAASASCGISPWPLAAVISCRVLPWLGAVTA